MHKNIFFLFAAILLSGVFTIISAQPAEIGISANLASGEVKSISEGKLTVQTKDGEIDVILSASTTFKKIPPGPVSLKNAVESSLAEISVGDKIMVTGLVAADKKTMPGKGVYLMTKADMAQRHTLEAEQWRTRGIAGKVTSVNPQTNQIGIEVRSMGASTSVLLAPKGDAEIKRYTANSVEYSEATKSTIADIKPGDMIRALGDRSPEGNVFTAEKIVTGAFQTVAGAIKAIDVEKKEVVITDFQTKKDIAVSISSFTTLKKFPEEMAQRMAAMQGGGGGPQGPGAGPRPAGPMPPGARPQGGGQGNGAGPGPGPGRGPGARGGIDDMFERFPSIAIADLKIGDTIAVSSTKTGDPDNITAIKLVSGVEDFIKAAQASAGAGGGNRGGQGGVNGSFTIPGLDGFGGP